MTSKTLLVSFFLWLLLLFSGGLPYGRIPTAHAGGGKWALLQSSIGISAMHMQLLHNDRVLIFDRTDFGQSNISLPDGKCRVDPHDTVLTTDCTAHSVEYNVVANSVRPLMVLTDVWCSSGSLLPDGSLIQTGGFNDGDKVVRLYIPCSDTSCDWQEFPNGLVRRRWYATNHILPDGRQIIIGGRRQPYYEFYPKKPARNAYYLRFLVETNDLKIENNLYPFVFLNVDGNLFIFANNRAILFDYLKGNVLKKYPEIPGGDPRCYPSTGSAVLLPLKNLEGPALKAEVLVCGGSPKGAFIKAMNGNFVRALNTCARIKITDPNAQWVMETMPLPRVMGDMVLLPNGNVLIINGASAGTAGWEYGRNPAFQPVIYRPDNPIGFRFEVQNPNTRPRMYHSTAVLLRDGRVLTGGHNPHTYYNFTGVLYPTDLSLEAFSPAYLDPEFANLRPQIIFPGSPSSIGYGQWIKIQFLVSAIIVNQDLVTVTMLAPPFNTHSFSMNQRLLVLGGGNLTAEGQSTYEITVVTPSLKHLAPPGYYLLFVVHQQIPSEGIWVQLK